MSKALGGCRVSYTQTEPGKATPLLKTVVGAENYDKDLQALGMAERFTNFLIAHPKQVRGKILLAIVSTSDDFSIGVGSTRVELLRALMKPTGKADELVSAATSLNDCQHSLFNAGDDFVELVTAYVGAEDDELESRSSPKR